MAQEAAQDYTSYLGEEGGEGHKNVKLPELKRSFLEK